MAKNMELAEARLVTVAAPYAVTSGQGALVGSLFGVAQHDAANAAQVVLDTEGGYRITKLNTDVVTLGAKLYWDNTNKRLTTTVGANTLVGVALEGAGNPSADILCRLNGSF